MGWEGGGRMFNTVENSVGEFQMEKQAPLQQSQIEGQIL